MYLGRLASKFKHKLSSRAPTSSFPSRKARIQPHLWLLFRTRDRSSVQPHEQHVHCTANSQHPLYTAVFAYLLIFARSCSRFSKIHDRMPCRLSCPAPTSSFPPRKTGLQPCHCPLFCARDCSAHYQRGKQAERVPYPPTVCSLPLRGKG